MLIEEARWFGAQIDRLPVEDLTPMVNVGSSTERFRTHEQPWIDRLIFAPLRDRAADVVHMDIKSAPGVDVVADLRDPGAVREVVSLGARSAFCSNLLEHVRDRDEVVSALTSMVQAGGYLFLSVPHRYPRHDDPIDTMYRPGVDELAAAVPGFDVFAGEVVSGGTYYDLLGRSPLRLARTFARLCVPMYAPSRWMGTLRHLPWLNRPFQETCVVLRKAA
jgi:hypothetical protein